MADRASTRGGSRRNTPQAAAANPRTTRTTRSQSKEISESDDPEQYVRKRRVMKKPPQGDLLSGGTRAGRSLKGNEANDLSIVNEDSDVASEDRARTEQPHVQASSGDRAKSPRRVSAFSGTTARTSGSAGDLDQSDDLAVDVLPDLWQNSDKILKLLIPNEISSETIMHIRKRFEDALRHKHFMQPLRSAQSKRLYDNLSRFSQSLDLQLHHCHLGSSEESPIPILKTLMTWLRTEDERLLKKGCGMLEAILYTANLAVLTSETLLYPNPAHPMFLATLDKAFPAEYTEATSVAPFNDTSTSFITCIQLAIDIRMQYAICEFERRSSEPGFVPSQLMQDVFYESTDTLKGWDFPGMTSKDMQSFVRKPLLDLIDVLNGVILEGLDLEAFDGLVDGLKKIYSWTDCATKLVAWVNGRYTDLKSLLTDSGDTDKWVELLETEVHSRRRAVKSSLPGDELAAGNVSASMISAMPSDRAFDATDSRKIGVRGPQDSTSENERTSKHLKAAPRDVILARLLRKRRTETAEAAPSNTAMQPASTAEQVLKDQDIAQTQKTDHVPASAQASSAHDLAESSNEQENIQRNAEHINPESEEDFFQTQRNTQRILKRRAQNESEANKENQTSDSRQSQETTGKRRLIDRQAGASKVDWDSQNSNLRSQQEIVPIENEDDVPEPSQNRTNRQALRQVDRRRAPEPAADQNMSPRRIHDISRRSEPNESQRRSREQTRHASQASQPTQPTQPRSSQVPSHMDANATTLSIATLKKQKPAQTRRPWSEDETETLIDLVGKHGISWSVLKTQDDTRRRVLDRRDQVALKDKARNIKVDFLCYGGPLPPNFEKISLGKKEISRVEGILGAGMYDRSTGDIFRDDPVDGDSTWNPTS